MTNLFLTVLNMSITASWVALLVIAMRLLLKRAPAIFAYILWVAVALRLLIPVSFASAFSLLRPVQPRIAGDAGAMVFVPHDIGMMKIPAIDAGAREVSRLVNAALPAAVPTASLNPMQVVLGAASAIWMAGAIMLLLYGAIAYLGIRSKVRTATLIRENVFETDRIATPFVLGFRKPRIYVPIGLGEQELSYVLLHEETHIRRRDHLIKPAAYLLLVVHWFNPLMWAAYALMNKDMEMSCDERAMQKLGGRHKRGYSATLLALSVKGNGLSAGSPLAFGESHIKARVLNILAYRQASTWTIAGATVVIAALIAGCAANPKPIVEPPAPPQAALPSYSGYDLEVLRQNATPYVGNASKVGGLVSGMPRPAGLDGNGLELQTKAEPYGLTVRYIQHEPMNEEAIRAAHGELFARNAAMLLSLIDNVDWIRFAVSDGTEGSEQAVRLTFTREQVERQLGEDVRQYAEDEASLRQLIEHLGSLPHAR